MRFVCLLLLLLNAFGLRAQDSIAERVQYTATRVTVAPKIDASLDDECWKNIPEAGNFLQFMPEAGSPALFASHVYVVYDDKAVYIAAQLDDPEPSKIATVLTPRDQRAGSAADHFIVGFDTYNDGLNGYRFELTAAGVQADARLSPEKYDLNWDAVWESATQVNEKGWALEIRIPYSAIRFPKIKTQQWGLQFSRMVQRTGELSTWSPTDPKIENIVIQWGQLNGLNEISPPPRLSFTPYVAAYAERIPGTSMPVDYHMRYRARGEWISNTASTKATRSTRRSSPISGKCRATTPF